MYYIGSTVSFSRADPLLTSREINFVHGNAAAFFMKPRLSKVVKRFDSNFTEEFNAAMKDIKLLPHAAYTINLCSDDEDRVKESMDILDCELLLGGQLNTSPVFHPGTNKDKKKNYKKIVNQLAGCINKLQQKHPDRCIIMETMGGINDKTFGTSFDELGEVISLVNNKNNVGVCMDTCHLFVSGYDIRTKDSWVKTIKEFDDKIGFEYLKGVHLNDSKTPFRSGHDVHAAIGKGEIGILPFQEILKDKRFHNIPLVTETHLHLEEMKVEIGKLKKYIL